MKLCRSSIFFIFYLVALQLSAQTTSKELEPGYYVVVAAYAETKEEIAALYVNKLKAEGYDANYGFNSSRHLYFVYLKYFTNLKEGIIEMQATRKRGKFTDAWVRVIPGDIKPVEEEAPQLQQSDQPEVSQPADSVISVDSLAVESEQEEKELEEVILQADPFSLSNTEVFLSLFNATNNRIVDGKVQIVDTERARLISEVEGNEYSNLPDPKSSSGQLSLISEVFGYRKVQYELNYNKTLADTVQPYLELIGTTFVVYFDLVRYRKGDIATLYNVYFYNDAAVMLPESKYQLNSLLQMMQEESYRIRLHGHTNGSYHGKIIAMGPSRNYFSVSSGDTQTRVGSAKTLSELRAQIIKDYLVDNGIDASRIEIKAWGGKRPLYDKNSLNARRNVRVEVEILKE